MKVVAFLVTVLHIASVYGVEITPYEVRQVTNESLWGPQTRIYGGQAAGEGEFPYMIFVLIYVPNGIGKCSASLIAPNWVLLAAHCVNYNGLRPENIILVGGKANVLEYLRHRLQIHPSNSVNENMLGVQERRAKEFFIHPQYDESSLYHDIALVRVNKPFSLPAIKTIPVSKDRIKQPKYCTILGWGLTPGHTSNYDLNYFENKQVFTTAIGCLYKLHGPFICLKPGQSGLCQGDSGGPLVCDNKVWGVASHLIYEGANDCGTSLEEYYSEIYPDFDWIQNHYSSANLSAMISLKFMFLCVFAGLGFFRFDLFLFKKI